MARSEGTRGSSCQSNATRHARCWLSSPHRGAGRGAKHRPFSHACTRPFCQSPLSPFCLPLQRHAIYTTPSPTSAFWDVFLSHTLFFSLSDSPLLLIILTHPSGVNSKAIPSERSFMMIPKLDQVPITNRLLQHDEMFPLYYFSNNTCFIHQIMPH